LHIGGLFDGCVDALVGKILGLYLHVSTQTSEKHSRKEIRLNLLATNLRKKETNRGMKKPAFVIFSILFI